MAKALLALLAIYAMKNMRRAGLRAEPAGRAPRRCQRRPARRRQQRWRARRSGVCSILNTLGGTSGDPRARFYAPDVL